MTTLKEAQKDPKKVDLISIIDYAAMYFKEGDSFKVAISKALIKHDKLYAVSGVDNE